jgi:hypothetical protein
LYNVEESYLQNNIHINMFAKTTNVGFAQRVVATLVACAMVLWSVGAYSKAQAANLTYVSDLLSTSEPAVTSAHTISFTPPTGSSVLAADSFVITFPAGFLNVNTVVGGDVSATVNGGAVVVDSFTPAANSLTISLDTTANAGQKVVVAIADGKITNPAIGSYEIVITTTSDVGKTRVAIVDTVLVSAIVQTTFDFTITGLATSTSVFAGLGTTTGSSSPTELAFGTLVAGTPELLAQRLNVTTNAQHGFVVTVQSDGYLQSANGAIIDDFANGTDVSDTGTVWSTPSNNVLDAHTWGHWGMASTDSDLDTLGGFYTGDFGGTNYIAVSSTTPREVFHHNGPSDGTTNNIGSSTVAYKIQITGLQEAADDYQTTLTYVATPTF